jgi:hypothetical protein
MSNRTKNCRFDVKDCRFDVMLTKRHRWFLIWMIHKYHCKPATSATAIRTCIEMMAKHLKYDLENDGPEDTQPPDCDA